MSLYYSPKIFLVDDDLFCQALYSEALRKLGYNQITCFEKGSDLLINLRNKPDLILLDYDLMGMKGLEILKKIKVFDPSIFVLVISGNEDKNIIQQFIHHGAFDYLQKGTFDTKNFSQIIDKWFFAASMRSTLKLEDTNNHTDFFLSNYNQASNKVVYKM